jgi:hypothetical protein
LFAQKGVELTHTEAADLVARLFGAQAWSHLAQQLEQGSATASKLVHVAQPQRRNIHLVDVLRDHYGMWGDCPAFPRKSWEYEVSNEDTLLGYWPWVAGQNALYAEDLQEDSAWNGTVEFQLLPPCKVTLAGGASYAWDIETHLSDFWGDLNREQEVHKPGLAILTLDNALLERLRSCMPGERAMMARKDGVFGLLFEEQFASSTSDTPSSGAALGRALPSEADVRARLLARISRGIAERYPEVDFALPQTSRVYKGRCAIWTFMPLEIAEKQKLKQHFLADYDLMLAS